MDGDGEGEDAWDESEGVLWMVKKNRGEGGMRIAILYVIISI